MTDTAPGEFPVSYPYAPPGLEPPSGPSPGHTPVSGPPPGHLPGHPPAPQWEQAGPAPVPDPPQGPGVTPPFATPPTEGRSSRLWFGLGIGALVMVLVCGGGIAAVIGLVTTAGTALNEQVQVVVGGYFEAVRQKRWQDAYTQLCEESQKDETLTAFTSRVSAQEPIRSYKIGSLSIAAIEPVVPVDVVYGSGADGTLQVSLRQDGSTGQFEVCSVEG